MDASHKTERIRDLETEVATTREALQQTIEELETSNEELQSLNEELQSTNEELQAANEELETSNEELQSTNEELITVNEELQVTASELSGRTGELASVLQSTPLAILVIDSAFQITQATRPAVKIFQLKEPIISPHISQCTLPEGYPPLAPLCGEALQMGETVYREFTSGDNRVKLSCSPYFEDAGKIRGVTIVISEFPGLAREMEMILQADDVYVLHRDNEGTILRISEAFAKAFGTTRGEILGQKLSDLFDDETADRIGHRDDSFFETGRGVANELIELKTGKRSEPIWLNLNRFAFSKPEAGEKTVYSIATDVTESVRARRRAETHLKHMRALQDFAGVGYWDLDLASGKVNWSDEVHRIHRTTPETYTPDLESGIAFYHPEDVDDVRRMVSKVTEDGGEFKFTKRLICADGSTTEVASHGIAVTDQNGKITGIAGFFREIGRNKDEELGD